MARPSKMTERNVETLLKAVASGMSNKSACQCAGVAEQTLANWISANPSLADSIETARESAKSTALQAIKDAGRRDWRAWSRWLELTAVEFRQPKQNVVAAVHVNGQSAEAISPEKLERIRTLRRNAIEFSGRQERSI